MRSVLLRARATRGLTLAELAVVVAVLAVILAIAIPFFLRQREDAYNKRAISSLRNSLSVARGAAATNEDIYPGTNDAELVTALTTIETSINHTTNGSQDYLTVSVHRRSDMSIVLAAYAAETETCWFLYNWHSLGEDLSELDDKTMIFNGEPMTAEEATAGGCDADAYDPSAGGPGSGNQTPPGDDGDEEEDGETGDSDGPEADPVLNPACHYDPSCFIAESWGDPHIVTFDGLGYEFMSVGEFVFSRSTAPNAAKYEVQIRTQRLSDLREGALDWVSVNTGVAADVDGKNIVTYTLDEGLIVNQEPVTLEPGEIYSFATEKTYTSAGEAEELHTEGYVVRVGPRYRIVWPGHPDMTEARPSVELRPNTDSINIKSFLTTDYGEGAEGVAGFPDTNPRNDLRVDGEPPLPVPTSNYDIHTVLAPSWQVSPSESLFAANGLGTVAYDPDFPSRFTDPESATPPRTLAGVDPQDIETARAFCSDPDNPVHPLVLDACIVDFLAAGGNPALEGEARQSALEATIPILLNDYDEWDEIFTFEPGTPHPNNDPRLDETWEDYGQHRVARDVINGTLRVRRPSGATFYRYVQQGVVQDQFTLQADVRLDTADGNKNANSFGIAIMHGGQRWWVSLNPASVADGNASPGDKAKKFPANLMDRWTQVRLVKDGDTVILYVDGQEAFPLEPAAYSGTGSANGIAFGALDADSGSGGMFFDDIKWVAKALGAEGMSPWAPNPWTQILYFTDQQAPTAHGWRLASSFKEIFNAGPEEDAWRIERTNSYVEDFTYHLHNPVTEQFTFQADMRVVPDSNNRGLQVTSYGLELADGEQLYRVMVGPTHVADGNAARGQKDKMFVTDLNTRFAQLRITRNNDRVSLYVDGQYAFDLEGTDTTSNHIRFGQVTKVGGYGKVLYDNVAFAPADLAAEGMQTFVPNSWVQKLDFEDELGPETHGWKFTASFSAIAGRYPQDGAWAFTKGSCYNDNIFYELTSTVSEDFTFQLDLQIVKDDQGKAYNSNNAGLDLADGETLYRVYIRSDQVLDANNPSVSYPIDASRFNRFRISKSAEGATLYVNGEEAFPIQGVEANGTNRAGVGQFVKENKCIKYVIDNVVVVPRALGASNMGTYPNLP